MALTIPALTSRHLHLDYKRAGLPKRQSTGVLFSPQVSSSKCHNSLSESFFFSQECLQAFNEHWIKKKKKKQQKSTVCCKIPTCHVTQSRAFYS